VHFARWSVQILITVLFIQDLRHVKDDLIRDVATMTVTCIKNILKHGFSDRFFHLSDADIISDLKMYNLLVVLQ